MSLPSNEPAAGATAPAAAAPDAFQAPRRGGWKFNRFLRARVGVEQLRIDLLAGRRHPRQVASVVMPYASGDGAERAAPTDLAQALAGFVPALARLQEKLDGLGEGRVRGLSCDVIIDDSWMLYDVVHADLRGLAPGAADALIAASLADVAGVEPTELSSRWQPQGASPYTLACGMPANAVPALREALATAGVVMGSVEGEFVAVYNRTRAQLDPQCAVLALVRDAGTQMAVLVGGVLTSVSFEFGVGAARELELRGRGLLRSAGVSGAENARFYVLAPPEGSAPEPWVALPLAA